MRGVAALLLLGGLVACVDRDQALAERTERGRAALEAGDLDTAVAELAAVVAARPDVANDLARAAKAAGRPAAVLPSVEAALERHPGDAELRFVAASLRMDVEQLGAAEGDLRRALQIRPDHRPSLLLLARLLTQGNRAAEAVDLLLSREDAICAPGRRPGSGPGDRRWVVLFVKHLGQALLVEGRFERAANRFEEAIGLDPDYAEGHYGLGLARLGMSDLEAARVSLDRAGELDPRHVEAAYQAMNVAERLGRETEAARARERFGSLYRERLRAAGAFP